MVRRLLLLLVGAFAGFAAAAATLRSWLPSRGGESSDTLALVAIFDGVDLESRSDTFGGGFVLAWFGGVALDLRHATLAPGACLDVRAAFGGVADHGSNMGTTVGPLRALSPDTLREATVPDKPGYRARRVIVINDDPAIMAMYRGAHEELTHEPVTVAIDAMPARPA